MPVVFLSAEEFAREPARTPWALRAALESLWRHGEATGVDTVMASVVYGGVCASLVLHFEAVEAGGSEGDGSVPDGTLLA